MTTPIQATWRVSYTTAAGYAAELTLTGENMDAVLQAAHTALTALTRSTSKAAATTTPETNGAAPMCPMHGKPMQRSTHGPGWYCTHKIAADDGAGKPVFCKQRIG